MPFLDIEQGQLAEGAYQKAVSQLARRRGNQIRPDSRQEV